MLHCSGKGFILYKSDRQPSLRSNEFYGRINLMQEDKHGMYWNAKFIGQAFDRVTAMSNGANINIVHGLVNKLHDESNQSSFHEIIVDEIEEYAETLTKSRMFVTAKNVRVRNPKANGQRLYALLSSNAEGLYSDLSRMTWSVCFTGDAFEPSKLLKDCNLINLQNAEIIQVYDEKLSISQVYMFVYRFELPPIEVKPLPPQAYEFLEITKEAKETTGGRPGGGPDTVIGESDNREPVIAAREPEKNIDADLEISRPDIKKKKNGKPKKSYDMGFAIRFPDFLPAMRQFWQPRPAKKAGSKYDRQIEKLAGQIQKIEQQQKNDAFYVLNRRERALMKKWQILHLSKRKAEIIAGKKKIVKKNNQMKKRRKVSLIIPRSTQQSIPYIADYEEGLFEVEPNKFSKTYLMRDINYLVAHMEEQQGIFDMYSQFLNHFSEDMNVAISIDNHIISVSEQERNIFYPDTGDEYDIHRHEYNRILRKQITAGRNDIKITKHITVTIDCDTPYEAILRFHKIDAEINANLRRVGSDAKVLSTDERLAMLHDRFRKGHEGEFSVNYNFLKEQGLSSKDYIAPASFRFEKSQFMIDDEYYRCLYVNNLPSSLVDTFLSELVDVEFPLITTLNIQPLAQDKALRLIKKQLTGMEANKIESEKRAVRSGYSPETISHDLKHSLAQAEMLLNDVQNNDQKLFFVTITLMVNGATLDQLEEHCKILDSKARQKTCQLQAFSYQQENAFKCTLPVGMPTYGKIFVERALTTAATAIFIPFSAQEMFQIGGFYYGLNQMSRNLILCDRTSMKTPSGFILGSPGSGKSFATKREQLNVLLQNSKTSVIVIDPENEYGHFARAFRGTCINISMESNNYVNPLDMSQDYGLDDEDVADMGIRKTKALQKKSDVIMSVVQSMISVGGANDTIITPQQKTVVDRAVRRAYAKYFAHNFDPEYLPTLLDLQDELDKERGTEDGRQMAEGVEYYTRGSMNVFSHKTNVNYDNSRFVVFNVRDLGTQLKQIALLIILDFIWNRLMTNFVAGVRTYCYVDEIHVLFQNEYSARFLQQLYKRGRKYGLVMTGITQNMTDLLSSEMSRSMIANSDFLLMLNQSPEDLKILSNMLNISEAQMSFVNRADAGCGLLFAEKVIVPFVDRFPVDSYLYKLMSTKFGEDYDTETVEAIIEEAQKKGAGDRDKPRLTLVR